MNLPYLYMDSNFQVLRDCDTLSIYNFNYFLLRREGEEGKEGSAGCRDGEADATLFELNAAPSKIFDGFVIKPW
jgi:hypothetical protein